MIASGPQALAVRNVWSQIEQTDTVASNRDDDAPLRKLLLPGDPVVGYGEAAVVGTAGERTCAGDR